jgi:hypothetical protein
MKRQSGKKEEIGSPGISFFSDRKKNKRRKKHLMKDSNDFLWKHRVRFSSYLHIKFNMPTFGVER